MIKFSDLKNEILQSLTNINRLIKLTEELYNSCDKYSKVKELFWKVNLNIFDFAKNIFLGSGFIYILCCTISFLFSSYIK
jgi:hypothetical protein